MSPRILLTLVLLLGALLGGCHGNDPVPDAGTTSTGDGAMCTGTVAYLQNCMTDDECATCICKSFGHSQVCTQTCTIDADCPAPSGGCTQGFCRR